MNIKDEIVEQMALEIQKEIDNEIMINMMKMNGWYVVMLSRFIDMQHPIDIEEWCNITIGEDKKKWTHYGTTFLFKKKKYAEWFSLRWL